MIIISEKFEGIEIKIKASIDRERKEFISIASRKFALACASRARGQLSDKVERDRM